MDRTPYVSVPLLTSIWFSIKDTLTPYRFGLLMFLGAFVTQIMVPDSRDADGESMKLEDLAKGRQYMRGLRKGQWWNRWHTAEVEPE